MAIEQFRTDEVVLSNINQDSIPKQVVMQGEKDGRSLTVQVTNGGVIEPQTELNLNLGWRHRTATDKEGKLIQGLDAFKALDRESGIFRIDYTSSMTQPGTIDAEIQFVTSNTITKSQPFMITVKRSTVDENAVESESSFTVLQEALTNISQYDGKISSLEINKADNAKVVNLEVNKADKTQVAKVEDMISKMPSATPKETFSNLQLLQAKYPTGDTSAMVVLEADGVTGYVYLWNGTAWQKGALYQSQGIADNSVSVKKVSTDLVDTLTTNFEIEGINVLSTTGYINYANGYVGKHETLRSTDFLAIDSNMRYKLYDYMISYPNADFRGIAFYSDSKTSSFLSGIQYQKDVDGTGVIIIEPPTNAKYMRFTVHPDKINDFKLVNSSVERNLTTLSKKIVSHNSSIVSLENSVNTISMPFENSVDISKNIITGSYINGNDGEQRPYSGLSTTDFLEINGKDVITILNLMSKTPTDLRGMAFYSENKTLVKAMLYSTMDIPIGSSISIEAPEKAVFFRLTLEDTLISKVRLTVSTWTRFVDEVLNPKNSEITPLSDIRYDGGSACIFKNIGFIGDSISSGQHEYTKSDGTTGYYTDYDFSFGQRVAKLTGNKSINFSRGGATCKIIMNEYTSRIKNEKCEAYNIYLGTNDRSTTNLYTAGIGTISDLDSEEQIDSFIWWYGQIIKLIKSAAPNAKIFCMTMPSYGVSTNQYVTKFNERIVSITEYFDNCYLVDQYSYWDIQDADWKNKYSSGGGVHLNAMGYQKMALDWVTHVSYIINDQYEEFKNVAFINSTLENLVFKT